MKGKLKKENEIAKSLYKLSFAELPKELQDLVHRWAKYEEEADDLKKRVKMLEILTRRY